jgi:VWFA-related protein
MEGEAMTMPMLKALHGKCISPFAVLILISGIFVLPQDRSKKDALKTPIIPSIKLNVEVVTAFVTVHDKKGTLIKDLTEADFTLKEDGKRQDITHFSREVDLPLTIGLIIQQTPGMMGRIAQLQLAVRTLFKNLIRPQKDSVFVMKVRDMQISSTSFEGQIESVQELTSAPEEMEKAVNLIGVNGVAGIATASESQTMLADAIYMAATKTLMRVQGRKALIIIGDDYHFASHLDSAVAAALDADTLIYAIRFYNEINSPGSYMLGSEGLSSAPGWNPDISRLELPTLAYKTGGTFFVDNERLRLDRIFANIEEELRSQYMLGYTPKESANAGFRKIKVNVKKDGMSVKAREGYYPSAKSAVALASSIVSPGNPIRK